MFKVVHFILLVLAAILTLLYVRFSDVNNDFVRIFYDIVVYVIGGSWSVLLLIQLTKNENSDLKKKLIDTYRGLLNKRWFVMASIIVLLSFCVFNGHRLLFERQVSFITEQDSEIRRRISSTENVLIGYSKAEEKFRIRLPINEEGYRLIITELENKEMIPVKLIVPSLFSDNNEIIVRP